MTESTVSKGVKIKIGASAARLAPDASAVTNTTSSVPFTTDATNYSTSRMGDLCDPKLGKRSSPVEGGASKKSRLTAAATETTQKEPSASFGPQVEIVDGRIVLKESSLSVNAAVDSTQQHLEYEEVEEGVHATARYSSFLRNKRGNMWGVEETRRFYECGTDFSLMMAFFPKRTRQQLKKKFIREERQHPELVKHVLYSKLPLAHLGEEILDAVENVRSNESLKKKFPRCALAAIFVVTPFWGKNEKCAKYTHSKSSLIKTSKFHRIIKTTL